MIARHGLIPAIAMALATATLAEAQLVDTSQFDNDQPIAISADSLEVEQDRRRATFRGAVDARQGDMTLKADELVVHYQEDTAEDGRIRLIEADGNVFTTTPDETAQGDSGTYDVVDGIIILLGNVVLTNAETVITGDQATINLRTGQSEVIGSDSRVNVLFNEEPDEESANEP